MLRYCVYHLPHSVLYVIWLVNQYFIFHYARWWRACTHWSVTGGIPHLKILKKNLLKMLSKQLVHASAASSSRYKALVKFREHSSSRWSRLRLEQLLRMLRASQTTWVLRWAILNWVSKSIRDCFGCFTSLSDWPRKLAPISHPIRCKTKTNGDLVARVFPPLRQFTCLDFAFLLTVKGTLLSSDGVLWFL